MSWQEKKKKVILNVQGCYLPAVQGTASNAGWLEEKQQPCYSWPHAGPKDLNFILKHWDVLICVNVRCKETSGNREEGRLDGGGADPAGISVKKVMQNKTGSKELVLGNEELVA